MYRVVVICAPTASGKTDLAHRLFSSASTSALAGKAEIISADSMQVYKYMDIGTAKPEKNLTQALPHHLIDIYEPNEQFGTGEFVRHATKAVVDISARGKVPVILGGTAFYIKNFVYGLPTTPQCDDEIRNNIEVRMKTEGARKLYDELKLLDQVSADRIHPNDEYRIKRALEVCISTGKPLSSFIRKQKKVDGYDFLLISLHRTREELYDRVEKRVSIMFENGLENEIQKLTSMGYTSEDPGMQAIGYREFFVEKEREKVKQLIIKNSKEYVKRQQTFFKSFSDAHVISCDNFSAIEQKIVNFIA